MKGEGRFSLSLLSYPGLSLDHPGDGPAEEPLGPAGGDRHHHHQAEAGAAGQGQHCGDTAAADQDEGVHESHNKEPHGEHEHDGGVSRPAR